MSETLLAALAAGITLGVPSGLAPGPLLALVITQTLRHGPREGALIAAAPLLTDLPVILAGLLLLGALQDAAPLFAAISAVGGIYVLYLAWETWSSGPVRVDTTAEPPRSLRKGVAVNLLNPHVYLFWGTVGVPLMLRLGGGLAPAAWLFAGAFFTCLVGGKVGVAWLVGRSRHLVEGACYRRTLRGLALLLGAFGALLLRDALRLSGLLEGG
ncbi:MAG TPA: LysE family translocator [Gammaproteobacteria bacterium]